MRTLTAQALTELRKAQGGDCWLWIIEIVAGSTTLRFTENTQNVSYGGNTYTPFPFMINLPDDSGDGLPDGELQIDNADQSVYDALVNLTAAATCKIGLVLGTAPGTSQLAGNTWVQYKITAFTVTEDTIACALSLDLPYDEPYTGLYFTPDFFPKLFSEVKDQ